MARKIISSEQAKNLVGATDWSRVKALTDRQIEEASRTDRSAKILEQHELPQFKRKRIVEAKP